MFQNDDGSWKGFYSNGKGCERHKNTATRWSGCPAAHLRFHLLKRGVTNDSALNLIRRSFTPQAFRDALQATFKDGKVMSAAQAEMQDELEDAKRNAPWVDITQGMDIDPLVSGDGQTLSYQPHIHANTIRSSREQHRCSHNL